MHDLVTAHARTKGSAVALVDLEGGRQWTWAEFDSGVNHIARWLIGELGAASGARVATIARNSANMILLQFACIRAGAVFVPFNWRLTESEIAVLLNDAKPEILFTDADLASSNFTGDQYVLSELEGVSADVNAAGILTDSARLPWDAPSTLLYTSGTSGTPKGVMISEANAFGGATNFLLGYGVSPDSVFLCDMPLFHVAGLFANARTPILAGGTLLVSKGFDPQRTLARLGDPALAITHYFSVPQMAQMLWNQDGFDPALFGSLKVYATGGAPNPAAQIGRFVDAGIAMSDGFGMTETCSNFGMPVADGDLLKAKAGSIGLPFISVEARIVDESGVDVATGNVGELWVRGPSVTSGYWNQPEKTAEAFAGDWFRTGDAARCDEDGYYYLVDRKKDMFISGGENIYPAEIEAAISELSEVAECAVIGIADEKWGEVGCAFVIAVSGKEVTEAVILAHCRGRLAGYKIPKSVILDQPIPRTASGKVQKHLLRISAS